jgi:hypothetical protein
MQEPISRRKILELAAAGAVLAAGLLLGACRGDAGDEGSSGGGGENEGGMGNGSQGRRRN